METTLSLPIIMVAMAVLTFAIRFLPLAFLSSFKPPSLIDVWLRNIVVATLSAMLFQSLFLVKGHLLSGWDYRLAGAIASLFVAMFTKNMLFTVVSGTAVVIIFTILS